MDTNTVTRNSTQPTGQTQPTHNTAQIQAGQSISPRRLIAQPRSETSPPITHLLKRSSEVATIQQNIISTEINLSKLQNPSTQQNIIPSKISLSDLQNPSTPLMEILETNPYLALSITDKGTLEQFISLLSNNQLPENQLWILNHIHDLNLSLKLNYHTFQSLLEILSQNKIFCELQSLSLPAFGKFPKNSTLDPSKLSITNLSLDFIDYCNHFKLPDSLANLSINYASDNHKLLHGNTLINIPKNCRNIKIQFAKNCLPCITSSTNKAITVSINNSPLCTASAMAIIKKNDCLDEQFKILLSSPFPFLLLNRYPELLTEVLSQYSFLPLLNLTRTCKELHKLRSNLLEQKAMITIPLSELSGIACVPDQTKINFALEYTSINVPITLNELLTPSEDLTNALKIRRLNLTLEITTDYELALLVQFMSDNTLSIEQLYIFTHLQHLDLHQCDIKPKNLANLFSLSRFTSNFKQLNKLSLGFIETNLDLSKSFKTIKYFHVQSLQNNLDPLHFPPSTIHFSLWQLNENHLNFSNISPSIESISIEYLMVSKAKLVFKNNIIIEIEGSCEKIKIPLKEDGVPHFPHLTSSNNPGIKITHVPTNPKKFKSLDYQKQS